MTDEDFEQLAADAMAEVTEAIKAKQRELATVRRQIDEILRKGDGPTT